MAVAVFNISPHETLPGPASRLRQKVRPAGELLVRFPVFKNCFGAFHRRRVGRGDEVTPDIVIVRDQNTGIGRWTIGRGVGILRNRDVVAPADTVFKGGIDTIIRRAAADNKFIDPLFAQQCLERSVIEGIASGLRDVKRPCRLVEIGQQCKPFAPLL